MGHVAGGYMLPLSPKPLIFVNSKSLKIIFSFSVWYYYKNRLNCILHKVRARVTFTSSTYANLTIYSTGFVDKYSDIRAVYIHAPFVCICMHISVCTRYNHDIVLRGIKGLVWRIFCSVSSNLLVV